MIEVYKRSNSYNNPKQRQKLKSFLALYYHIVTFKEPRKIIAKRNKEIERESKFYNPNYYWKGRKVVSLDQWFQIKYNYGLKTALQYFPNNFQYGFSYVLDNIEDQLLKQEAEQWYSNFIKLRKYSKNMEKQNVFAVFQVQIEKKLQYLLE
jgi:hypothetical protein